MDNDLMDADRQLALEGIEKRKEVSRNKTAEQKRYHQRLVDKFYTDKAARFTSQKALRGEGNAKIRDDNSTSGGRPKKSDIDNI